MATPTNPFGDVSQLMQQFKLPGVDMAAIVEARRKDIDALMETNQAVFESMQAMASKQTEMLNDAMQGMQDATQNMAGGSAMADPAQQTEVMRKAFDKTLAGMQEMADMARHAQTDAMTQMTQRASKQMQDIKALVQPK
jgi:phasin family protein